MNTSAFELNSAGLRAFHEEQLTSWQLAHDNCAALKNVETRTLTIQKTKLRLQYNPARIISSTARIDNVSLAERPCFLCKENRPVEQQTLPYNSDFAILVNPYPILPYHFTIPTCIHTPQTMLHRVGTLMEMTDKFSEFVFFYNGASCGASAPDHAHFQAGVRSFLPIEEEDNFTGATPLILAACTYRNGVIRAYSQRLTPFFEIRANNILDVAELFAHLITTLPSADGKEAMFNLLAWRLPHEYIVRIFPRIAHRPRQYYADDSHNVMFSPGALDMGGLLAIARKQDYDSLDEATLSDMFSQVCPSSDTIESIALRL